MRRQSRARERGFTMVELLVTMTITIFALMGALAVHASMTRGLATSAQMTEATVVAVQTMENLRAKRTLDVAAEITGSSATSAPFARDAYTSVIGRNGLTYTVDVAVTPLSATLWKMRIEVNWRDDADDEERSVALELVRASAESL